MFNYLSLFPSSLTDASRWTFSGRRLVSLPSWSVVPPSDLLASSPSSDNPGPEALDFFIVSRRGYKDLYVGDTHEWSIQAMNQEEILTFFAWLSWPGSRGIWYRSVVAFVFVLSFSIRRCIEWNQYTYTDSFWMHHYIPSQPYALGSWGSTSRQHLETGVAIQKEGRVRDQTIFPRSLFYKGPASWNW